MPNSKGRPPSSVPGLRRPPAAIAAIAPPPSPRTDPEVATVFAELTASRDARHAVAVEWLLGLGVLTAPDNPADLRLRIGLLLSAEHYVQLTSDWSFTDDQYRTWLTRALAAGGT